MTASVFDEDKGGHFMDIMCAIIIVYE